MLSDPTVIRRLLTKFQVGDGCWIWEGSVGGGGYGQFWDGSRRPMAHRVVYELLVGPIPDGLMLDHLCRVRRCVRPDHLEPVTHRENQIRGEGFVGLNARKTHCVHGHKFTTENTRIVPSTGERRCITCVRSRDLRYYYERKEKAAS